MRHFQRDDIMHWLNWIPGTKISQVCNAHPQPYRGVQDSMSLPCLDRADIQ